MLTERYPSNLVLTVEDFTNSGWKAFLSDISREGYSTMWQVFSTAARQAIDENRLSHGKVLWLLADACSMTLSPKSINEPFKPFFVTQNSRSIIPNDFAEADITFYSEIIDLIDDAWLNARLADLVWLLNRKLGIKFALNAIDSYMAIPIDSKTWVTGGRECWGRAISLSKMLRAGAGNRLEDIETAIVSAFDSSTSNDGFLGLWLADLLAEHRLARAKSEFIATKLDLLANQFDLDGDLHRAKSFFDSANNWFQNTGNIVKASEVIVKQAECWVKEAIAQMSAEQPNYLIAANFFEKAIQIYRTIPRTERAIHSVDERIIELHRQMNAASEESVSQMGIIKTPSIDIAELIDNARQSVTGKTLAEALFAFANIYPGIRFAKHKASSEKILQQSLFSRFFASTHISKDGRVIARQPARGLGDESADCENIALWSQMVRDYQIQIEIVVQGEIWPAHEVLLLEHRLTENDFISLAQQSSIIPTGRERMFGRALSAGYERDFVTALHLLVPQIEHMVRTHLKNSGAKTTNLDKEGVENENGLSTLMEMSEVVNIFGEDLAFELKALFCCAFGPNLRNELAHGLLEDTDCYTSPAIYAWWLGLRLVFNTFWNATHAHQDNVMSQEASS